MLTQIKEFFYATSFKSPLPPAGVSKQKLRSLILTVELRSNSHLEFRNATTLGEDGDCY